MRYYRHSDTHNGEVEPDGKSFIFVITERVTDGLIVPYSEYSKPTNVLMVHLSSNNNIVYSRKPHLEHSDLSNYHTNYWKDDHANRETQLLTFSGHNSSSVLETLTRPRLICDKPCPSIKHEPPTCR